MRDARAFTLIELLVVIAIIALLLSLLAPSLASARAASQLTKCAVQARQLQIANDLHSTDHNGHYAPGAEDFRANLSRWHGQRTTQTSAFEPALGPLASYLGGASKRVRRCPSLDSDEIDQGFEKAAGGYGYNNAFVGTQRTRQDQKWVVADDRAGSAAHRFRSPSKTVAFSDAAFPDSSSPDRVIEYSFVEPRFQPENPAFRHDPSMHFRHTGTRANIIALDGSSVSAELAWSWSSGFYTPAAEEVSIGWHESPDDNSRFDYD